MKALASSKRYRQIILSMIIDVSIYFIAYLIALSVRSLSASILLAINIPYMITTTLILAFIFTISGIYNRMWSRTSGNDVVYIIRSTFIVTILSFLLYFAVHPRPVPGSVLVVFHLLALSGFVLVRYNSRLIGALGWRYRAIWLHEFPNLERVLIIGAGDSGQHTALRIRQNVALTNYRVVGFLDDDVDKIGMIVENCPVLGTTSQMSKIVSEYRIDLIIVAIHNISGPEFRRILSMCERTEARIKIVPDPFKLFDQKKSAPTLRDVTPEDLIGRSIITKHKDVDLSAVSNRVVLVTGAAGSIGSEITRQILDYKPSRLILVDNNESALHDLHIELRPLASTIEIIPCLVDVSQYNQLQNIFQIYQPSIVFHAAAYKHVPMLERYPYAAIKVNVGGTMNAVELALLNSVERFVLISTDKAVKPTSVMGASKRICEQIVHAVAVNHDYGTKFTTVRFGNVLGSRGSVVPTFNRQIDQGGPVTVTHPEMTRYFMSISEATNLVIHAAAMTTGNDVFLLRMGEVVRIVDLAERMIRIRGLRPNVDIPIVFSGIRAGEKLHEQLYEDDETTESTIHPHIIRVLTTQSMSQTIEFMERLRILVRDGFKDDTLALDELTAISNITSPVITLPDNLVALEN